MTITSHPLVAVVTPVLNGEEFLAETMDSVQAQTYPNLIHIVLDNASTDATAQIIDRYRGARVPVVTARKPATVPMARNWNDAIAMIPGEARYFRLLCADDMLRPNAIESYVDVAERDPDIGLVGCLWRASALCGEELPADREIFDGRDVMQTYLRREHSGLSGMHALIRCSALSGPQPFYDETLASFDTEANLRIARHAKFGFVRQELSIWRIHANSTTNKFATNTFLHEVCWLTLLDRYGPEILGYRQYVSHRKAFRRHLLRRMLKTYLADRNAETFKMCLQRLREAGDPAMPRDFADAMANWAFLAATWQRHTVGRPARREEFEYGSYKQKTAVGF
jgi:glycosyltransferase involved in cell wall biosynthesis